MATLHPIDIGRPEQSVLTLMILEVMVQPSQFFLVSEFYFITNWVLRLFIMRRPLSKVFAAIFQIRKYIINVDVILVATFA